MTKQPSNCNIAMIVSALVFATACSSKSNSENNAPAPKLVAATPAPTPIAKSPPSVAPPAGVTSGELAFTIPIDGGRFAVGDAIEGELSEPGHDSAWLKDELGLAADDPSSPSKLADGLELKTPDSYATYRTFGAKTYLCRANISSDETLHRARTTCLGTHAEGDALVVPFTLTKDDKIAIVGGVGSANATVRYAAPNDPATLDAAAAQGEMVKSEKLAGGYWLVLRTADAKGNERFAASARLKVGAIDLSCQATGNVTADIALSDAKLCTALRAL